MKNNIKQTGDITLEFLIPLLLIFAVIYFLMAQIVGYMVASAVTICTLLLAILILAFVVRCLKDDAGINKVTEKNIKEQLQKENPGLRAKKLSNGNWMLTSLSTGEFIRELSLPER